MPVNLTDVGIQSVSETLSSGFSIEKKLETAMVNTLDGSFSEGKAFDPTFDFSISGSGDIPAALVVGSDGDLAIAGITGGVTLLTNAKETYKNTDFNSWEASGKNFPGAA